jgi:quercetin dioxygenase-like cupin family protein
MVSPKNLFEEAKKIEKPGKFVRKRVTTGDGFDIDLYAYCDGGENRYHACSKDEYFYVLKGHAEMILENGTFPLREGEGFMVKADIKHKHTSDEKLWMLVISKWPHEHTYYDQ